jgi:hypothetical protein
MTCHKDTESSWKKQCTECYKKDHPMDREEGDHDSTSDKPFDKNGEIRRMNCTTNAVNFVNGQNNALRADWKPTMIETVIQIASILEQYIITGEFPKISTIGKPDYGPKEPSK